MSKVKLKWDTIPGSPPSYSCGNWYINSKEIDGQDGWMYTRWFLYEYQKRSDGSVSSKPEYSKINPSANGFTSVSKAKAAVAKVVGDRLGESESLIQAQEYFEKIDVYTDQGLPAELALNFESEENDGVPLSQIIFLLLLVFAAISTLIILI